MYGTLYLVATPIGNLKDISERAIEVLRSADIIAAEDTRNSIHLLTHFDIHTKLTSYHEYNKVEKAYTLISELKDGKNIALITDAGTPGISDPGEVLVKMCHEEEITVTSLPGPCALINALILSGLSTRRFCFEGFLPTDKERISKKERKRVLDSLVNEERTIIMYEAPHRLKATLNVLFETLGNRKITLCRELTKKFEDIFPTDLENAIKFYDENDPRGEYVLVIEGLDPEEKKKQEILEYENLSIEEHMSMYTDKGIDKKEAMKLVAKDRGITKREVYDFLIKKS